MGTGSFMCAYCFKVDVVYSANVAERPQPGQESAEAQYIGDVTIAEFVSGGITLECLPKKMKTGLRDAKPPKRHLVALRPVLSRLESSLAYFARRFERRFITRVVGKEPAGDS